MYSSRGCSDSCSADMCLITTCTAALERYTMSCSPAKANEGQRAGSRVRCCPPLQSIGENLAHFPTGPALDDKFWLYLITYHVVSGPYEAQPSRSVTDPVALNTHNTVPPCDLRPQPTSE